MKTYCMSKSYYAANYSKTPIFYDLIIRLVIARGYAHNMDRKLLTAEKVLQTATDLIKASKSLENSVNRSHREGAPFIPLEILEQKCLLHRGLLALTFEDEDKAKQHFEECI